MNGLGIAFDAAIIVIFAVCLISGLASGLVRMLLRLAAALAAGAGAYLLSAPAAKWIFGSFVSKSLTDSLSAKILAYNSSGTAIQLPFGLQSFISGGDIAGIASEQNAAEAASRIVNGAMADAITGTIRIIAFVVIFLILLLILLWVAKAAAGVNKVPVLGPVNRVLGGLLGGALGFIICYVSALLANFVVSALGSTVSAAASAQIDSAIIYNWLLKTDLLSLIK